MRKVQPWTQFALALFVALMAGLVIEPVAGVLQHRPRRHVPRPNKRKLVEHDQSNVTKPGKRKLEQDQPNVTKPDERKLMEQDQPDMINLKPWQRNHTAVFIAGIEGTLHHFWYDVFKACVDARKCVFPDGRLQTVLWNNRTNLKYIEETWNYFVRRNWLMSQDTILYLNWAKNSMLSYPNMDYSSFPELENYAKAAKANGGQLKVILMLRDADDIVSSAKARFGHTAKELVMAAFVLEMQLKLYKKIFPDLLTCVETTDIPFLADELDEFFINPVTGQHILNVTVALEDYYENEKMSACRGEECHDESMKTAMDKVRAQCDSIVTPIHKEVESPKTKETKRRKTRETKSSKTTEKNTHQTEKIPVSHHIVNVFN